MLKHIIVLLSFIQLIHCLSARSNNSIRIRLVTTKILMITYRLILVWWSRRGDSSETDCKIEFDSENLSLEGKICGYCYAKCQQQFAACLLAQMNQVITGSIDYCEKLSKKCETTCFNDKRTGRIAEANWEKVVKILRQFNSYSPVDNQKKH
ncbi:unnamed protein product [Rotaria socialis]|uniref:Uncharacterized protein n=1 Tax=Rotaria socialis TaxID=392032 RepID=A0A821CWL6_9BILA|nr:unnamed protein product [Rotaria socialis]CAF4217397.1 unnamed protein product [Rotaria socialis]CAF4372756.1 unnamed protein product [Rotaria socialis]CAF4612567.1 unnamed protein product [Rotaria socialis]CAF4783065.1 unnamed protein product [Rotaria socialis]